MSTTTAIALAASGDGPPPWEIIPMALAAGALSASDAVHLGAQVEQVGRSHPVYRVSVGGEPRFYLKCFGPSRGATDGSAAAERAVLTLAASRPEVGALVPRAWTWRATEPADAPWAIVATEAVDGIEAWRLDEAGGGTLSITQAWREVVDAVVGPLAAFHRSTRDLARSPDDAPDGLRARVPWGLSLMDGDSPQELWAGGATTVLLTEAASDPALVTGLREARSLWRPLALVHTDLKLDNLLVQTSASGIGSVRVVDWEMARIGDPAWDLGAMSARLVCAKDDSSPPWSDTDIEAVAHLVASYAHASGLAVPGLAHRVVNYAGVVLLMMALQSGSVSARADGLDGPRLLVMRSRATFANADRVAASLIAAVDDA